MPWCECWWKRKEEQQESLRSRWAGDLSLQALVEQWSEQVLARALLPTLVIVTSAFFGQLPVWTSCLLRLLGSLVPAPWIVLSFNHSSQPLWFLPFLLLCFSCFNYKEISSHSLLSISFCIHIGFARYSSNILPLLLSSRLLVQIIIRVLLFSA